MFLFLASVSVIIILIYQFGIKPFLYWKNLKVPYVKPVWPLIGNLAPLIFRTKNGVDYIQSICNSNEGRYFGFYTFLQPILMIKDIDLIKQIGITDFDHFCDRKVVISEEQDPIFGRSILSLKGQHWREMRSTLSPTYTSSKLRLMFGLITECCEQFNNHFLKLVKPNESLTIEMKDTYARLGTNIMATTAFGFKCNSLEEPNNEFYLKTRAAVNFRGLRAIKVLSYHFSEQISKMLNIKVFSDEIRNFYRNIITSNIKTREENGIVRPDMIHLLMEARKGNLCDDNANGNDKVEGFAVAEESNVGRIQETKLNLSYDDITAQVLVVLLGGFSSVATTMSFMSYELAINEDVQRKLQNEIDSVYKTCEGTITYEALLQMKYLDMVISETLRKWPSFPGMDRMCTKNYTIEPKLPGESTLTLRKGDTVWIPVYHLHRNPKYFPNPDQFNPERFSYENKVNILPFTYLPFGIGPKNCIASRLALLEIKVLFFYALSKFNFVVCEKTQIPLRIKKSQFNLSTENGTWLGLQLRNSTE